MGFYWRSMVPCCAPRFILRRRIHVSSVSWKNFSREIRMGSPLSCVFLWRCFVSLLPSEISPNKSIIISDRDTPCTPIWFYLVCKYIFSLLCRFRAKWPSTWEDKQEQRSNIREATLLLIKNSACWLATVTSHEVITGWDDCLPSPDHNSSDPTRVSMIKTYPGNSTPDCNWIPVLSVPGKTSGMKQYTDIWPLSWYPRFSLGTVIIAGRAS